MYQKFYHFAVTFLPLAVLFFSFLKNLFGMIVKTDIPAFFWSICLIDGFLSIYFHLFSDLMNLCNSVFPSCIYLISNIFTFISITIFFFLPFIRPISSVTLFSLFTCLILGMNIYPLDFSFLCIKFFIFVCLKVSLFHTYS